MKQHQDSHPAGTSAGGWFARALGQLFPTLEDPGEAAALEAERQAFNVRRARMIFPLVFAVSLFGILAARVSMGALVTEDLRLWRHYNQIFVGTTLVFLTGVLAAVFRVPKHAAKAADLAAFWTILWGAMASGNVQRVHPMIDFFLFFSVSVVVAMRPPLKKLLFVQALAWGILVTGILTLQKDPTFRRNEVLVSWALTLTAFGLARANTASMVQEVQSRWIIARQQRELESLNTSLEDRVHQQVAELVARSREVGQLNAELREQVKERSRELSEALARVARQHENNGGLKPGTVLAGRFLIGEVIGRGGMGVVVSAIDQVTEERVAIKVIEPSSAHELDAIHRFLREAQASARVSHPAIVYARHVDVAEGVLFMVFAYIDGESLDRYLTHARGCSPSEVARLGALIADALAAAHEASVVHRDIKPGNIILTRDRSGVRLLDFGISKLRDAAGSDPSATREGAIMGTPAYMAPEQVRGSSFAVEKSDVYSLGVVLYELLAGRVPFHQPNLQAVMLAHVLEAPPSLSLLLPEVPVALAELVHRCLAKEPAERPSAAELAAELTALGPTLASFGTALTVRDDALARQLREAATVAS